MIIVLGILNYITALVCLYIVCQDLLWTELLINVKSHFSDEQYNYIIENVDNIRKTTGWMLLIPGCGLILLITGILSLTNK